MRTPPLFAGAAALALLCAACSKKPEPPTKPEEPAAKTSGRRDVVLFLGDSLTAGYGVGEDESYPALVAALWKKEGAAVRVRNAGVSGATTADDLENLDWYAAADVRTVFLELGANDGLRGLPLAASEKNLSAIIETLRARGIQVVLAGMKLPPNYGPVYAGRFEGMYASLARRYNLKMMPFLLEGVAGRPELNGPDGIHPNASGHKIVAANVHDFFAKERLLR